MNGANGDLSGIHHITAIAGDPQKNIDFHSGILGLRLVKLTVNFDDPSAYHLYFGDKTGSPGTILTFFAWPGAQSGRRGVGQVTSFAFTIPEDAIDYWTKRFDYYKISYRGPQRRFDERVLTFFNRDGLQMELVEQRVTNGPGWPQGPIPEDYAIRGIYSVTILERSAGPTAKMLSNILGFKQIGEDGEIMRLETGGDGGTIIDIVESIGDPKGLIAGGCVHHIAWRTPTDEQQAAWRSALSNGGIDVTQIIDRRYFRSIYFREPGSALFEIATDAPGFTIDEPERELGSHLKLPPWMERDRRVIQSVLPPIELKRVI